jgi:hypothetical protein
VSTPGALPLAIATYGIDRLVFGSDHPFFPAPMMRDLLEKNLSVQQVQRHLRQPRARPPAARHRGSNCCLIGGRAVTAANAKNLRDVHMTATLVAIADSFTRPSRSPVFGSPAEIGLPFENVTFASEDAVPLEGWFVPADGARTTVIVNHPRGFSRSGLPANEEPWRSAFVETGNDIAVDLIQDLRILHDAGYHVLAYDLRNFALSGAANGGVTSSGNLESRDVIGSVRYARSRPE